MSRHILSALGIGMACLTPSPGVTQPVAAFPALPHVAHRTEAPASSDVRTPPSCSSVRARVSQLVARELGIDVAKVKPNSHLFADLGGDSLDHVEVIMAVEDDFGIEIPDKDAESLCTPARFAAYVRKKGSCTKPVVAAPKQLPKAK